MDPATPSRDATWQVICLCAAWCGVCRDWTPVFEELARMHPRIRFEWVDIEDHADAMGDMDVETFPTLLVAHGDKAFFLGPVQPSAAQVARLVDSLVAAPEGREAAPPAHALLARLRADALPKR